MLKQAAIASACIFLCGCFYNTRRYMDVEKSTTTSLKTYHIEASEYVGPISNRYFTKRDRMLGDQILYNLNKRVHLGYDHSFEQYTTGQESEYTVTYLGLTRNPLRWVTAPLAVLSDFGGMVVTGGMWGIGSAKYDMRIQHEYPRLEKRDASNNGISHLHAKTPNLH